MVTLVLVSQHVIYPAPQLDDPDDAVDDPVVAKGVHCPLEDGEEYPILERPWHGEVVFTKFPLRQHEYD